MKRKEIIKQPKTATKKPSFLINQRRKGDLVTNKIYNHFLKIVLQELKRDGNHDLIFYTTMEDIKQKMNLGTTNNNRVWEKIRDLQDTKLEQLGSYDKKDKFDEKGKGSYHILGSVEYSECIKGLITFDMSPLFVRHLMKLDEDNNTLFARLEDKYITNFKIKNSLVLYEFFMDYKGIKNGINKTEENLRILLDLEEKYKEFKDFKKVINKSVDEINEKTNLNIDVNIVKELNKEKGIRENIFKIKITDLEKIQFNKTVIKQTILKVWSCFNPITINNVVENLSYNQQSDNKYYLTSDEERLSSEKALKIWDILIDLVITEEEERQDRKKLFFARIETTEKDFFEEYDRLLKYHKEKFRKL